VADDAEQYRESKENPEQSYRNLVWVLQIYAGLQRRLQKSLSTVRVEILVDQQ
jgi:hypothetical protein